MLFKGPKSLLDSITNVIKEERVQYAKEQAEMDKLVAEKMLSPKQKKIAKVAGDPDKMDAADFAALRSGKKMNSEGYNAKREHELNMDAAQRHMDRRAAEGEDMTGAKIHPKTYEIIMPKSNTKKMAKEEVEQVQEGDPSYYKGKSTTGNALPPPGSFADRKRTGNTFLKGFKSNPQPIKPYVAPKSKNEEIEHLDELSVDLLKRARDKAERISGDSLGKNPIKMKAYQRQADTFTDALHKKYKAQLSSGKRKYVEEYEHIDETLGATSSKYGPGLDVPSLGKEELKKKYLDADTRTRYTLGKAPENHTDALKGLAKINKRGEIANKVRQSLKNEATDTPGNGREHQCAIHVKNEQFGEGKTLTTQHAEPDENGDIAWYDVMFDHGIERVMTEDLDILVSEAHVHNKPKKGM